MSVTPRRHSPAAPRRAERRCLGPGSVDSAHGQCLVDGAAGGGCVTVPVAVTVWPVVSARADSPRSAHRTPATSISTQSASRFTVPVTVRTPRTRSPRRSPSVGRGVAPSPFGRADGLSAGVLALSVEGAVAGVGSLVGPGEELAVPPVGELEADGPAALGAASVFAAQPTVAAAMAAVASRRAVRISPSTVRGCGRFPETRFWASGNRGWSE